MPELPEVETVVRELRPKLKNKTIQQVEVRLPKMVTLGPATLPNLRKIKGGAAEKFSKILRGQKITNVKRRAKMIIIDLAPHQSATKGGTVRGQLGKYALLVHLKMTGQLIYLDKKHLDKKIQLLNIKNYPFVTLPAKSTHIIFDFTDGAKLFYNDYRQFGYLKLVTDKELLKVKELAELGPEPLDKFFTFFTFVQIIKKFSKRKLKELLMDPKVIAGIGNIYSDEILFCAKVRPTRTAGTLMQTEQKKIFNGIKKILTDAVRHYGSSVGDFVRPSGDWGSYGLLHKVYGRAGERCKACGSIIKSLKFNGRTGSFCPKCQH